MIEPRLPQRSRLGRPPKTAMRSVVNALLYMVRTGCQWRRLPREVFTLCHRAAFTSMLGATTACWSGSILNCCCKRVKRPDASQARWPVFIDTVKTTRRAAQAASMWQRKSKAASGHVVTDTAGLLLAGEVHPADTQDRDGPPLFIAALHDPLA